MIIDSKNDYSLLLGVLGGAIIQICLGSTYAWSTFAESLNLHSGITAVEAQWVFGIRTLVFSLTMIPAGFLLKRLSPRTIALASSFIFGAGHAVPALSPSSFVYLALGMGILAGIGIGGGYMAVFHFCANVKPKSRGLLIGIGVGCFGAGSLLASSIGAKLLSEGLHVTTVFTRLGFFYCALCALSSLFLPGCWKFAKEPAEVAPAMQLGHSVVRKSLACFLAKFSINCAGLAIIGNMIAIAQLFGHGTSVGLIGISVFSIGNILGRFIWGFLFDKFGRKTVLMPPLVLSGFLLVYQSAAGISPEMFAFLNLLIGFCFGSAFVLYASFLSEIYGTFGTGILYPLIFSSHGLGAIIGPALGAFFITRHGTFVPMLMIAVTLIMLAFFVFYNSTRECFQNND